MYSIGLRKTTEMTQVQWGRGGSGTIQPQTKKIEDHGYKNFVFPNHENKQARKDFNDWLLIQRLSQSSLLQSHTKAGTHHMTKVTLHRRLTRDDEITNIGQQSSPSRVRLKTFRSRITKNNFLNSSFTKNKIS